jgi:hypothetical protein
MYLCGRPRPERKHQPVLQPFGGERVGSGGRDDAFDAFDVALAGEERRLAGRAQALDLLPLAGIQCGGGDISAGPENRALPLIGAAGASQRRGGQSHDENLDEHEGKANAAGRVDHRKPFAGA